MTSPRQGAVAAPLPDGRVLVAGGIDETGQVVSTRADGRRSRETVVIA